MYIILCYNNEDSKQGGSYMKIKMKDIANMAGVSETTVSLVLNNKKSRISKKKQDEIKELAKKHHYRPNMSARGLASRKTNMIGLVIPDIENSFFAQLAKNIDLMLREKGYFLILTNSDDSQENEFQLIDQLINIGVDGLLITLSNESYSDKEKTIEKLNELTVPYVLMDRNLPELACKQVYYDNVLGGYLATKMLLDAGHRNIGFIKASSEIENANDRWLGYQKAMKENKIKINEDWVAAGNYRVQGGYEAATQILNNKEITAVAIANDMMALGFIKKVKEQQLEIPEDISIVGYDHSEILEAMIMPLSSIIQDSDKLAEESVGLLIGEIDGSIKGDEKRVLTPEIFIGNSVKKYI